MGAYVLLLQHSILLDAAAALNALQNATSPLHVNPDSQNSDGIDVGPLRVRLEAKLGFPAVVAVTSATADDGKELIARSLAYSLATAGYATLLIETSLTGRTLTNAPLGMTIPGIGRLHWAHDVASGKLAVLTITDPTLRRATKLGEMKAATERLRSKFEAVGVLRGRFECVIVSPDAGTLNAFANAMLATADAVFVSVAKKRRETPADKRLITELEARGPRYMGVVAVDPAIVAAKSPARLPRSERTAINQPRQPKPGFVAGLIRTAIWRLRGGRRRHVAHQPPLLQPAPEAQTTPLSVGDEPIAIASGQGR